MSRLPDPASFVVAKDPDEALTAPVMAASGRGDHAGALALVTQLLASYPHSPRLLGYAGALHLLLEDHVAAEPFLRAAIALAPDDASLLNNLAVSLRGQDRLAEAEEIYHTLLAHKPDYAKAWFNFGNCLVEQGRKDEAVPAFERAWELSTNEAEALFNLGNIHWEAGRLDKAVDAYTRLLKHRPDLPSTLNNLGCVLLAQERPDVAANAFRLALKSKPDYREAMVNRAKALGVLEQAEEAAQLLREAIALEYDDDSYRFLLFQQARLCDWSAWDAFRDLPVVAHDSRHPVSPPLSLTFEDEPERQLIRSRARGQSLFLKQKSPLPLPPPSPDGRIRVGYFSFDFFDHATMLLMSGVFRQHDRSRFAIHAYCYGPEQTEGMRNVVTANSESFHDVRQMNDEDLAQYLRDQQLDIIVDLKGYTHGSRNHVLGARCAPVQVAWLGYPGSIGHPAIDYAIADAHVLPPAQRHSFDEKVVFMPGSYQPNDNRRPIAYDNRLRMEHGLPAHGFVFCSFNHTYKTGPAEWDVWMRLLREVDGSVLWLLRSFAGVEDNLRREAAARGVDPARLVFAPSETHYQHLGRLRHADLFLDSFNINAHTTCSDALWAGLPVVTRAGRQFSARVGASLLHAAGLPEMITHTSEDYFAKALELAREPAKLAALRARLRQNHYTCDLFNTTLFTRRLEAAFAAMHQRAVAGLPPDDIVLG